MGADEGTMAAHPKFTMRFEPRTIEHLGLRLYNTLPPVIVELVTNAYDAESPKVEVVVPTGPIGADSEVIVRDYGHGMTAEEIQQEYLPIGRNRRGPDSSDSMSKHGKRRVTGRKGLGKLSAFGVAEEVEIRSVNDGQAWALRLNYAEMQNWAKMRPGEDYEPDVIDSRTGDTDEKDGVEVTLRRLHRKYRINPDTLRQGIARRLSMVGPAFRVYVNGDAIKPGDRRLQSDCKPEFSWTVEDLPRQGKVGPGLEVSGWLGFVQTSSQVNRGIDIYANGKAAELGSYFNYPSTHAQFARAHLVGELHADFLDAPSDDLIATARNAILWEEEEAHRFEEWGHETLRWAFERWVERRREEKQREITSGTDFDDWLTARPAREQKVARSMVRLLINDEKLDPESARPLLEIIKTGVETAAFQELVDAMDSEGSTAAELLRLFEEWRVIEGRVHVQISDGRWSAMDKLEEYIEEGALEVEEMAPLLVAHPWLLDTAWDEVSVEQQYTKLLRKNCKEPQDLPEKDRRLDIVGVTQSSQVTVVELKRPEKTLNRRDLGQVEEYVDWARANIVGTERGPRYASGLLVVGKLSKAADVRMKMERLAGSDIRVTTYRDLYQAARDRYAEVESRLKQIAPEYAKRSRDRRAAKRPAEGRATPRKKAAGEKNRTRPRKRARRSTPRGRKR